MAVIPTRRFADDVAIQIAALEAEHEWAWLEILEQDLDLAIQLLARFPDAGRVLASDGARSLRKLRLRRAPYYLWYRTADGEDTYLVRLFHVRQRTARPGRR